LAATVLKKALHALIPSYPIVDTREQLRHALLDGESAHEKGLSKGILMLRLISRFFLQTYFRVAS
jgi:hypothetical protein